MAQWETMWEGTRGRWANLVVLDGEPFAPGSRVETVLVRGKVLEAFKEGGMR